MRNGKTNKIFGSYVGPSSSVVLNSNSLPYKSVYNNYYLENDCNTFAGTHNYYKILSYDPTTFTVVLPTPITPTNNYNIRKEPPLLRDVLGITAGVTTTEIVLGGLASSIDDIYINCRSDRFDTSLTTINTAEVLPLMLEHN